MIEVPSPFFAARSALCAPARALGMLLAAGLALSSSLIAQSQPSSHFPLSVEGARNATDEGQAFLECRVERTEWYVHEPIRVRLRLGLEQGFLNEFLLPLFRPPMDLGVQVQAAWLENLPGASVRASEPDASGDTALKSLVLNDDLARARALAPLRIDARDYRVFEIERRFFVDSPGVLQLPPALLRFAFATRFDEGFLDGRIAADRIEAYVLSAPRTLRILDLPEQGRPSDFSGAVGTLQLRSEIDRREVDLGSSLKFSLYIEGQGNLERFDAPRLEALDGWRVLGLIEVRSPSLRTIEYDLAPRAVEVLRVPSIGFSYFDTNAPASYRTLRSEAHEVHVRANAATKLAPPGATTPEQVEQPAETPWVWILGGAIGLLFAALGARALLGSKRGRPGTASGAVKSVRVKAALAALRAQAAASDAEVLQVFAEYLAARLGLAASSVLDPGLEARLIVAGVPRELALRTQTWIESLVAARYGGKPLELGAAQAGGLLKELEAAFATRA